MSEPIPMQLAIQGGGAKIVHLLAALEGVQELESEGKIRITRIAGTSAGAVAGCAYAAGVSLKALRDELKMITRVRVQDAFPARTTFGLAARTLINTPFWSTQPIVSLLNKKFGNKKVADLSPPVLIVSTDLRDRTPHVSSPGSSVVNALLDSTAIPFYFRSAPNSAGLPLVDGGICENLPSDILENTPLSGNLGPIYGISLRERKAPAAPQGRMQFAAALLNAAMENSVERARRRLQSRLFIIDTDVDTFDFPTALQQLGDPYDLTKRKAREYFERQEMQARASLSHQLWEQTADQILTRLTDVYRSHHHESKFRVISRSLEVRALSLIDHGRPELAWPDETVFRTVFQPSQAQLGCMKIDLAASLDSEFWGTYLSVRNRHGQDVPHKIIPFLDQKTSRNQRACLLFFTPPLTADRAAHEGPYQLIIQDRIRNSMANLRDGKPDYINFETNRVDGAIDTADLLLYVPAEFRNLDVFPTPTTLPSAAMTQDELAAYTPPAGFRSHGWRFRSVPDATEVRVTFI